MESTRSLVLRLRGGMQIFVKTLRGKIIITLKVSVSENRASFDTCVVISSVLFWLVLFAHFLGSSDVLSTRNASSRTGTHKKIVSLAQGAEQCGQLKAKHTTS